MRQGHSPLHVMLATPTLSAFPAGFRPPARLLTTALLLLAGLSATRSGHSATSPRPGEIQHGFTVPGLRQARTFATQPDGRVLLVGAFTNSPSGVFIVRLAADGSIDWKSGPIAALPQTLAVGPGGQVFSGGDNTALRFLPPTVEADTTFAAALGWRLSDAWAAAYQPDGALLVAGSGATAASTDWGTERGLRNLPLRILPNGSRDTAFATKVGVAPCTDIAVLPDGSFLAARTEVQRFLADGTLDPTFTPWKATGVELLRRLSNGDFLVGGGALRTFNGTSVKPLIRVGPTGIIDPGFQYAGSFDVLFDTTGPHRTLAVLGDGRLVIGQPAGGVRRFLADGSSDPNWTDPAPTVAVRELAADAAGNVYVIGNLEGNTASQPVYRLAGDNSSPVQTRPIFTREPAERTVATPGGTVTLEAAVEGTPSPDLQWFHDGVALPGATSPSLLLPAFLPTQAGSYQLRASNSVGVAFSARALVFLAPGDSRPGTIDVSFEAPALNPAPGEDGFLATTTNPLFWGGAPSPDGGLFLWGNFAFRRSDNAVETGVVQLDTHGRAVTAFRPGDHIRDAGAGLLQDDGKLVLGAVFTTQAGEFRNGLVRLLPDGTLDPAFTSPALFEGTTQAAARRLLRLSNRSFLVGGAFNRVLGQPRPGLLRLHPDGSLDSTFAALPISSQVNALALAPDGRIYAGGSFSLPGATVVSSVIRLHPDGTLDSTFTPFPGSIGAVDFAPHPAGGVLVLTTAAAVIDGRTLPNPFHLDAAGTPDAGFDPGVVHRNGDALLARPDGAWLVSADTGNALSPAPLARHLAGGALDPFYTNAPAIAFVRALLPAPDQRVWVVSAGLPGAWRLQAENYVPPQPPLILRQPENLDSVGLTSARFRVVADGVRPLSYQWRFEGTPIPGATSDTWIVAPITPASLGAYDVVVTGGGSSTTSNPARLGNLFPPTITLQPVRITNVVEGSSVTLTVAATGTEPLHYQWRRNEIDLPGANSPSLVLSQLQLAQQGGYSVRITNVAGSVISSTTDLKIQEPPRPPSIVLEPIDRVGLAGTTPNCLEVGVAGSPPFRFQWQKDGTDLPGATNVSLCLGILSLADAGRYRLVVLNDQGRAESRDSVLTVIEPVFAITTPPATVNLVPNRSASFDVAVRNDLARPLTYRWRRDGIDIPGATNRLYRLETPSSSDVGAHFDVVVSDGTQDLDSPDAVPTGLPELFLCPGGAASVFRYRNSTLPIHLGVDATGFGPFSYQWRKGPAQSGTRAPLAAFVPIPGATAAAFTLAQPSDADAGDYICDVSNAYGSSLVDGLAQVTAIRVRVVDEDRRPGRVDFDWDYQALGDVYALNGVEFLDDGRVYVAGGFGNPLLGCSPLRVLARLLPNGTLDPTFQPVTAAMGNAVGLVRQPSGKLVVAGNFRGAPGQPDPGPALSPRLARFNADGSPDPTFQAVVDPFDGSGGIQIAGQRDGRILVFRQSVVYRLLPDGAKDDSFGGPINDRHTPGIDATGQIGRLIVDAQDRLYVLTGRALRRYLPQGEPDPAWNVVEVPETLMRLAVAPDGTAYATAYRANNDPTGSEVRIVKFLPNGLRDSSFAPEYPVGGTIAGAPGVQPDQRLVLGGTLGTLSARLGSDGTRDASWDAMASPGGVSAPAFDPYWFFAPDGRALVAAFAFDDALGFSVLGERWLFRLHNGGTGTPPRLETPRFLNGNLEFEIPTEPGRRYEVQFLGSLGGPGGGITGTWATQQTLTGNGSPRTVRLGTTGTVGFYRVMVSP